MIDIRFEIGGRRVRPDEIGSAIDAMVFEAIAEDLRNKLGGIRDPDTGEFPAVIVRGRSLDDCAISVEGSKAVIALVTERMGSSYDVDDGQNSVTRNETPPYVFLCHASEDKTLVRRIAEDLTANGVEVFYDDWCITYGDSIRQRIDKGLQDCTHFVVLLTETSLAKPWVNAEIDAGFVQKLSGKCRFVPLRYQLGIDKVPPLLAGIFAPEITDYDADIESLVKFFHGVTERPPLGDTPDLIKVFDGEMGISPAAKAIVDVMMRNTENGLGHDPLLDAETLLSETVLSENDLVDAVFELEARRNVRRLRALGEGTIGFVSLSSEASLFVDFDAYYHDWSPEDDGLRIAVELVNGDPDSASVPELGEKYEWRPRRMNPAIAWLMEREAIETGTETGAVPWRCHWLRANHATRRLLTSRS